MDIWSELEEIERKYYNYEITLAKYFDLKHEICNKYVNKEDN